MTNTEIAKLLNKIVAAYTIKNEKKYRFQIIAYKKASNAIDNSTFEITDLIKENKLHIIEGLGPQIQQYLSELLETGKVDHFNTILNGVPESVFPLLEIPSIGPKKAFALIKYFNLTNPRTVITDIKRLANEGQIAQVQGFGIKSQSDILRAITEYKAGVNKITRMVLPYADEIAEKIISYMKECAYVKEVYPLGSLRRRKETIGDIDIAASSYNADKVIKHFTEYPYTLRVIEQGPASSSILISGGKHVDLMVQPPEAFGSLLQHFTGSKDHNIHLREYAQKKGFSLSEYGIREKGDVNKLLQYDAEDKLYNALGLEWIPPELREDTGEIELAEQNKLPSLVELNNIKGDFHLHSNYPIEPSHDMGVDSMETMVKKAEELGYSYVAFSEHNPSQSGHTSKQVFTILKRRKNIIEQINKNNKSIHVFSLLETDILPNGKLAIDDDALSLLDATLVSIHSVFSMNKLQMTKRILKGLSHPKAKILTHPTGRILNERIGYNLDWNEIFSFCKSENKALEINAYPTRLDLPDQLVYQAKTQGVKFFISTDSHSVSQMDLMEYGVSVARRGWATRDDILNAQEYNKIIEFLNY